jgi:hypothetical protein
MLTLSLSLLPLPTSSFIPSRQIQPDEAMTSSNKWYEILGSTLLSVISIVVWNLSTQAFLVEEGRLSPAICSFELYHDVDYFPLKSLSFILLQNCMQYSRKGLKRRFS